MAELTLKIDRFVFERVPDYRRAVVVGVRTRAPDLAAIEQGLSAAVSAWQSHEASEILDVPSVQRWRKAYRRVGLNPTRTRPAAEAVMRRAHLGKVRSFGDACVDVGAIVSLVHAVPVGMHALDGVGSELVLTRASGEERFSRFDGMLEHPSPGELVYLSGTDVLTRHWVHQQGKIGSVQTDSRAFAVNLDLLADDPMETVVGATGRWLDAAGVSVTATLLLNRVHPSETVALPVC